MRFNSKGHLKIWLASGVYPAIHAPMTNFAMTYLDTDRILDLGCGFGLLGHSIAKKRRGAFILGVEANQSTIDQAIEAGVNDLVNFTSLRVNVDNMHRVAELCTSNGIKAVIARRVFPELFGADPVALTIFGHQLADAGITQIFIQGRVPVHNPTTELSTIQDEVRQLRPSFEPIVMHKDLAYLKVIRKQQV